MADYYTQFSCLFDVGTAGNAEAAITIRARHHRLPLHLDLSDLEPNVRIHKAAAFFAGLIASPHDN